MARPTKYTPEIQAKADEYVSAGFLDDNDVVPSIAGLALKLDISRSTVHEWKNTHAKFSDTLGRLSYLQERISLNGGLKGDLNSTIVKLLLANHGYSDKQTHDHQSTDGTMTPPPTQIIIQAPDDE